MTRDRLVSVFVVLTAVAVAVVVWVLTHRHERTVVQERPQTTVLVEPPLTPLRDSGPKNNNARTQTTRRSGPSGGRGTAQSVTPRARNRPLSPRARRKAKTPRTTRPHRHRPVYTPPGSGSPPPPSQRPPVDVQVPAPLTVCVRPAGGVNCP